MSDQKATKPLTAVRKKPDGTVEFSTAAVAVEYQISKAKAESMKPLTLERLEKLLRPRPVAKAVYFQAWMGRKKGKKC